MKVKRKISVTRYIAAFSITTFVFLFGIFIGYFIAESKTKGLLYSYEELWLDLTGAILQTRILEAKMCDYDIREITSRKKIELGREIEYLEKTVGKTDRNVLRLKEEYHLLSLNQFLLLEQWIKNCNKSLSTILYFYSNTKNAELCEQQGYVLDYIYAKYPANVSVYVFDVDIENPALEALKSMYGISVVPTLVVDGKIYPGFQSKDKVEGLIKIFES